MPAGQCKVDPVTGVAGDIFSALIADTDNGLLAAAATSGSATRALIGAQIEAIAASIAGGGGSPFLFRLDPTSTGLFGTPRSESGSAPSLSTTTYRGRPVVRITANSSNRGFVPITGLDLSGAFRVDLLGRWNGAGSGQRIGFGWNANDSAYTWFGCDTPGSGQTYLFDENLDGTGQNYTAYSAVQYDSGVDFAPLSIDVWLDTTNSYATHSYSGSKEFGVANFQQRRYTSLRTTGAGNTRCGIFTNSNTGYLDIAELIVWKIPRAW